MIVAPLPDPGVLPIPQPSLGPTPRLQLNDPATVIILVMWLGAAALKAVPALAGYHIDQLYPLLALAIAGLFTTHVVGKKHDQAAALATAQLNRAVTR